MVADKCAWQVTAGIIPGHAMPELTRAWGIASGELEALDDAGRTRLYRERQSAAMVYAADLMDPHRLNWVRVEWIWF